MGIRYTRRTMKQTAVEWLVEQIKSDQNQKSLSASEWMQVINQAKQMEKEQSITDYKHGQNNGYMYRDGNGELIQAEQYYNETYARHN